MKDPIRRASKFIIDPIKRHASYFENVQGLIKELSIPNKRPVFCNWNQRVLLIVEIVASSPLSIFGSLNERSV